MLGEVAAELKKAEIAIADSALSPRDLADLIALVESSMLSRRNAKAILPTLVDDAHDGTEGRVAALVESLGIGAILDPTRLRAFAQAAVDELPTELALFREGNHPKLANVFVGKAIAATNGRADAKAMRNIVLELIKPPAV